MNNYGPSFDAPIGRIIASNIIPGKNFYLNRDGKPAKVLISGGGPVGLLHAILLKKWLLEKVEITLFENRWKQSTRGIAWKGKEEGNQRRTQVVTLQSRPLSFLPTTLYDSLFPPGGFSEIWPYSSDSPQKLGRPKNIRIADLEDRLLKYAREMNLQLIPQHFSPKKINLQDFDILSICEGAHSTTRQYFKDHFGHGDPQPYSIGDDHLKETILGFQIKSSILPSKAVMLTLMQNRFLLNMTNDGYGHLNMRLCQQEADELERNQDIRNSSCWHKILEGFQLFDIDPSSIKTINKFKLGMVHRNRFSSTLSFDSFGKPTYGFLLGDAANAIHFWPGRGLNQGLVSAISLTLCLQENLKKRNHMREGDFSKHEALMHMLQHRHKTRAWNAMTQRINGKVKPIKELISESLNQPITNRQLLVDRLLSIYSNLFDRLKNRLPDIPAPQLLKNELNSLTMVSLNTLVASRSWDTFWSGGPEVNLSMFYSKLAREEDSKRITI